MSVKCYVLHGIVVRFVVCFFWFTQFCCFFYFCKQKLYIYLSLLFSSSWFHATIFTLWNIELPSVCKIFLGRPSQIYEFWTLWGEKNQSDVLSLAMSFKLDTIKFTQSSTQQIKYLIFIKVINCIEYQFSIWIKQNGVPFLYLKQLLKSIHMCLYNFKKVLLYQFKH